MHTITLQHDNLQRRYLLFAPSGRQHLPLVLFLHGTGGSAAFAIDETQLIPFAEQHGFAVAFPDGLPINPSSPARFLSNPQRWNDGAAQPGEPFYSQTDDVGFLAAVVEDLRQRGICDPNRVYLTGFSNGAGMVFRAAAARPDLFAAIAPVAGYCWVHPAEHSLKLPTLYILGTKDLLIPLHGGEARLPWGNQIVQRPTIDENLAKWAKALSLAESPEKVSRSDGVELWQYPGLGKHPNLFQRIQIEGLGHHWPGGRGQFNPRIGGPYIDNISANTVIWDFFHVHHRDE